MAHVCEDIEHKFNILAKKLRTKFDFRWVEIQRDSFFVMEIAEFVIETVSGVWLRSGSGHNQRYAIARITPIVNRVYHDEFASYHLLNVSSGYQWKVLVSNEVPNPFTNSQVIEKIHNQKQSKFVMNWIKEHVNEDLAYEKIEDCLNDLIIYGGC